MNNLPPRPPSPPTPPGGPSKPGAKAGAFKARALSLRQDDDAFDALTDLFLGEVAGGKRAHAGAPPIDGVADEPARPRLRLAGTEPEIAPAFAPSTSSRQATAAPIAPARPVLARAEEEDAPADALGARGTRTPAAGRAPGRTPVVECLVVGNLPVLASAWASQYVREVALAAGRPVAYLRVQGGFAGVEIVGGLPGGAELQPLEEGASLADAVEAAAAVTDRWIIRADAGREAEIARRPLTRVVTLLTGTDEMARAACARSVEGLGPAMAGWDEAPVVRIAVMGGGEAGAAEHGAAMAEAAAAVLGTPVQRVSCPSQIRGGRPALSLYSGPAEMGLEDVLGLLSGALGVNAGEQPAVVTIPAAVEAMVRGAEPATPGLSLAETIDEPAAEPDPLIDAPTDTAYGVEPVGRAEAVEHVEEAETPAAPEPAAGRVRPASSFDPVLGSLIGPGLDLDGVALPAGATGGRVGDEAAARVGPPALLPWLGDGDAAATTAGPAAEIKPVPVADPGVGGSLASYVEGLSACAARCPYAEGVEIGLDRGGCVHLLVRSDVARVEADRAEADRAEEAALQALLVASSWAESHAALLVGTLGGRVDRARRPVMHLFTGRPKRSRRLLETPVRVHLLAPVSVDGRTGWCCVELN